MLFVYLAVFSGKTEKTGPPEASPARRSEPPARQRLQIYKYIPVKGNPRTLFRCARVRILREKGITKACRPPNR